MGGKPKLQDGTPSNNNMDEATLLWDEYKYRHDLIWRHLIRSTIAVVALITVSYSTKFDNNQILFIIAALLAIIYTIFSFIVLNSELALFEKIKVLHRQRQNNFYTPPPQEPLHQELEGGFSTRARWYLAGLFLLALAAAMSHVMCAEKKMLFYGYWL